MNDNVDDGDKSKALLNESSGEPASEAISVALENGSYQEAGEEGPYSEVFWSNAVETTLHQTHPRVPQLTTQLVCQYKFEYASLYVRTLRYKMTTRNGNWKRANIDLYLKTRTSVVEYSPDSLIQDGAWHDYSREINSPYAPVAEGGLKNRMYIRVDYDGTNNDVEPHEGYGPEVYPAAPPFIDNPGPDGVIGASFIVAGSNGLVGGTIHIYVRYAAVEVKVGTAPGESSGRWQATCRLPSDMREKGTLSALQTIGDQTSVRSNSVGVYPYRPPIINDPPKNAVLKLPQSFKLRGTGTYPWDLDVMTPGGNILHASTKVKHDMTWEADFNLANYPNGGEVAMTAGHRNMADWSDLHSFVLLGTPIINVPGPLHVTDPGGPISGTGRNGAIVEVFKDNQAVRIGQTKVEPDGNWKIDKLEKEMSPGPYSIVARQTLSSVQGDVSTARGFKVRPPTVSDVSSNVLADGQVIFAGQGHTGATVEITRVSGPDAPPIPAAPVENDKWETTAVGWPFGTYTVRIIQKVGDGASGWIESLPFSFSVNKVFPDVWDVKSTIGYKPTVTGKGTNGATVQLLLPGGASSGLPNAAVTNGQWSSTASAEWGPTFERAINIRQSLNGQDSPNWVAHLINIPPLAPGLNNPVEDGLSPKLSGTCWRGAVVKIQYSDEDKIEHEGIVTGATWNFQRDKAFAPDKTHTVTVTQFAGGQTSAPASKTFTVKKLMLKPVITQPAANSKVGRVVTIEGEEGMKDATMRLRDALYGNWLGQPEELSKDGAWSIQLTALEFRFYTLEAQQTLDERPSDFSIRHNVYVVLLPPEITRPTEGGRLSRTDKLKGSGMANGYVEVFQEGLTDPLLRNIPVNGEGHWEAELQLPVGRQVIWARQTFTDEKGNPQESDFSQPWPFDLVPAEPFIETPLEDEQVGRQVVVSGFGVPGDTVTVQLNLDTQNTVVLEDRTWSVTMPSTLSSGVRALEAKAIYDGFESDTATRTVEQSAYQPSVDEPAAGRWLSDPLSFAGKGLEGAVQVVSWFNPDLKWSPPLVVADGAWRGESEVPLPLGGNWGRVRQTLGNDPVGVKASDWAQSARFEVVPASSKKT